MATKSDMDFIDTVFSWSLEDIFDDDFYKDQVQEIPVSFQSPKQYLGSYVLPLLDETRAEMLSSMEMIAKAPYAEVTCLEAKGEGYVFDVEVDYWRNRFSDRGKQPYKTLPGDVLVIADAKPETASDLQRIGRTWTFALVTNIHEDEHEDDDGDENEDDDDDDDEDEDDNGDYNNSATHFKVEAREYIESKAGMQTSLFVVYLMNITTNRRIWKVLQREKNLKIIEEVLCTDSMVKESCSLCSSEMGRTWNEKFLTCLLSELNESQKKAILASLNNIQCKHNKSHVELIWGPPGTGKTTTVSVLLFTLLSMKYRTLTCAPTNVAITVVVERVLKLVKEAKNTSSASDDRFFSLGDILLFGNKERLKVDKEN
ncbi:hypothetical protein PTKIN_Ptkin02bG0046100 [Pterospermum kingtungense]